MAWLLLFERSTPPEFKEKVGLEALRGRKTINETGQEHGVHPVVVLAVEEGNPGDEEMSLARQCVLVGYGR